MVSAHRKPKSRLSEPGSHGRRSFTKNGNGSTRRQIEHEVSSGNVFADLRVPEPETALAKVQLARAICRLIEGEGLTQKAAAARLGIDQPKVSALLRGRLEDFSTDRLLRLLLRLGHNVDIQVESARVIPADLQVTMV